MQLLCRQRRLEPKLKSEGCACHPIRASNALLSAQPACAGANTHNLVWYIGEQASSSAMTLPVGPYPSPSKSSGSPAKHKSLEDVYNSPAASPALAARHEARRPLDPSRDAEAATQLQHRLCTRPNAAGSSAVAVSDGDTDDDDDAPLISCVKPGVVMVDSSTQSPAGSSATSSGGVIEVVAEWNTPTSTSLPAGAAVTSPNSCSAAAKRHILSQDSIPSQVCSLTSCALLSANETCFPRQ